MRRHNLQTNNDWQKLISLKKPDTPHVEIKQWSMIIKTSTQETTLNVRKESHPVPNREELTNKESNDDGTKKNRGR